MKNIIIYRGILGYELVVIVPVEDTPLFVDSFQREDMVIMEKDSEHKPLMRTISYDPNNEYTRIAVTHFICEYTTWKRHKQREGGDEAFNRFDIHYV